MRLNETEENALLDEVAAVFGISRADLIGRARRQKLSAARAEVAARLYGVHFYTEEEVGAALGRSRGTARHLLRAIRR